MENDQDNRNPDGTKYVIACEDSMKVLDASCGDELYEIQWQGRSTGILWSPDGQKALVASEAGKVGVWNAEDGRALYTLSAHEGPIRYLDWSPDGTKLASCGPDETIRLWEVSTGKEILTLQLEAFYVAWSPTGDKLASCSSYDHTAKVWDASNGKELHTLQGHEDGVKWVAWRKCGTKLASCSDDETVKIWSIPR